MSAERSFGVGGGLTAGEAGHPLVFQVVLADVFGNRCDDLKPFLYALPVAKIRTMAFSPSSLKSRDSLNMKANATLRNPAQESPIVVQFSLSLDLVGSIVRAHGYSTGSGSYDLDVSYRANHSHDDLATGPLSDKRIFRSPFEVRSTLNSLVCP